MKLIQSTKKYLIGASLVAVLFFVVLAVPVLAQSVTQGYGADAVLQKGMIVGLLKDNLRKVEPINKDQLDRVYGVVVGPNDSAVLIGRDNEKVYVATTGRYTVLVSDQQGSINTGDLVTVSSVSGIGMKSTENDVIVIGKALDSFVSTDKNQIVAAVSVKEASGRQRQLLLGHVLVDINIGKNPKLETGKELPDILKKASELIANKPVSTERVYISLVVLAVTSIISGSLIYGSVRSSLIAIGRNPLSRKMIIRGLFQVVIIVFMVFLSGIFSVYLILKL